MRESRNRTLRKLLTSSTIIMLLISLQKLWGHIILVILLWLKLFLFFCHWFKLIRLLLKALNYHLFYAIWMMYRLNLPKQLWRMRKRFLECCLRKKSWWESKMSLTAEIDRLRNLFYLPNKIMGVTWSILFYNLCFLFFQELLLHMIRYTDQKRKWMMNFVGQLWISWWKLVTSTKTLRKLDVTTMKNLERLSMKQLKFLTLT